MDLLSRFKCFGFEMGRESGVVRIVRDLGGGVLPVALKTVAVAVHLQDMHVAGEKTSVHSSKGRLVVTRMEPRS